MYTDRHRTAFWAAAGIGLVTGIHLLAKKAEDLTAMTCPANNRSRA